MNKHLESGRTEQKLNTRGKILKAANRLLDEGKTLTMDNIAEEANISRATIYRYYSSVESLSTELVLQLNVPASDLVLDTVQGKDLASALLDIQNIYLDFILNTEVASRKFLGAILSSTDTKLERGKNRLNAVKAYFIAQNINIQENDIEKLIHIAVLLMGIESIIVSKDVCGLDEKKSKETLRWGLEMVLKGLNMQP